MVLKVQKAIDLIHKHEKRRLRILVANDDSFQLLIISSSLQMMRQIEKIDTATNGQVALDLVMEKEE